jgi:hypothetical protein
MIKRPSPESPPKQGKPKKPLQVLLDEEVARAVHVRAAHDGRRVSDLVEEVLRGWLKMQPPMKPLSL